VGGGGVVEKTMDKPKIDPREYTIKTLKSGNGKRITEVLLHYWKHKGLITGKKRDIVEQAKEIFG
jgi:hypothetical protein